MMLAMIGLGLVVGLAVLMLLVIVVIAVVGYFVAFTIIWSRSKTTSIAPSPILTSC